MRYTQHQNCTGSTVGLGKADYLKNPNINQSLDLPVSSIGVILSFTDLIGWAKWLKWTRKSPFFTACLYGLCLLSMIQFSSVAQSFRTLYHPMDPSTARPPCPSPNPRVYSNSCPLSRWYHPTISSSSVPSPTAFNLSQHHGLFQWVSSSSQLAKVLEFQLKHQSFQWIFGTDFV